MFARFQTAHSAVLVVRIKREASPPNTAVLVLSNVRLGEWAKVLLKSLRSSTMLIAAVGVAVGVREGVGVGPVGVKVGVGPVGVKVAVGGRVTVGAGVFVEIPLLAIISAA